jgi:hypothetical protein
MKKAIFFLAVLSFVFSFNKAVAQPYTKGLGLEAGGGYSQLYWRAGGLNGDRLAFSLSPTVRTYLYLRSPKWGIQMFTGWNRFGGKSGTEPNGYHDAIWIKAWESGLFCLRHLGPNRLGPGLKYNYHLKVFGEYYGFLSMPPGTEPVKSVEDWSDEFAKVSIDLGLRYSHRWKHLTASAETWFGLTNLAGGVFEDIGATVRQCHYRVLVGVEI